MENEQLADVWSSRDLPVLVEIARRIDAGERVRFEELRATLHLDDQTLTSALAALKRRKLIEGIGAGEVSGLLIVTNISAEAYFLTGLHPGGEDDLSALVQTLRQAAEQVEDPEERTRLARIADGMLDVSRGVMTGVLTAYLSTRMPS